MLLKFSQEDVNIIGKHFDTTLQFKIRKLSLGMLSDLHHKHHDSHQWTECI
jgi:hypothetical protein